MTQDEKKTPQDNDSMMKAVMLTRLMYLAGTARNRAFTAMQFPDHQVAREMLEEIGRETAAISDIASFLLVGLGADASEIVEEVSKALKKNAADSRVRSAAQQKLPQEESNVGPVPEMPEGIVEILKQADECPCPDCTARRAAEKKKKPRLN